jgi:creatinine amidohydrolase
MDFAGTLTLRESTFQAVCHDYCTSLARHGFTRICLLPSHGGNFKPIADALDDLNKAVGPASHVSAFTDLVAIVKVWRQIIDSLSGLGERVGGHADIAESSVMLCLHPQLVQQDLAEAGFQAELTEDLVKRIMQDGMSSVTPNGILGDARGMSEEIGTKCLIATADLMAEHFAANR